MAVWALLAGTSGRTSARASILDLDQLFDQAMILIAQRRATRIGRMKRAW